MLSVDFKLQDAKTRTALEPALRKKATALLARCDGAERCNVVVASSTPGTYQVKLELVVEGTRHTIDAGSHRDLDVALEGAFATALDTIDGLRDNPAASGAHRKIVR